MGSKIIIDVPSDSGPLAEVVAEYGGQIEFDTPADEVEAAKILAALEGSHGVTIKFDDPVDPMDTPLDAVAKIGELLDARNSRYVLLCDAFVEPSRGLRVLGRVVANDGTGPRQWNVPWEHGAPSLDVATLSACGLRREEASAIVDSWLKPARG